MPKSIAVVSKYGRRDSGVSQNASSNDFKMDDRPGDPASYLRTKVDTNERMALENKVQQRQSLCPLFLKSAGSRISPIQSIPP